ncbi:MAG: enoyl-CoA hydratase-related protein, partial [Proteobacteria bacterium]|nr:enoyl-CoA hydratase-related protein [Pseudomonadota bacterium]
MSDAVLMLDRQDHSAIITLNRPDKLNALSADLRDALTQALLEVRDDDQVRAVIITGSGRGFCSGADLSAGAPAA